MSITLSGRGQSRSSVRMPAPFAAALAASLAASALAGGAAVRAAEPEPSAPVLVEVEQGDGTVTRGRLEQIDPAGVRLVDDEARTPAATLPGDRVRAVRRTNSGEKRPHKLVLTLVDGSTLSGDDFAWDGKRQALVLRPEGRIELPVDRIRSIAWQREAGVDLAPPVWRTALPERPQSDLVVVGTEANPEFVECAITGVSAESVTVVLDEETIPVKRAKVIGLEWLRGDPAADTTAGGTLVEVSGGEVRARRVEWSTDALVVDGEIRLPAAMLSGIDYAAGRTLGLAGLEPEKVVVEPWFGGLVRPGWGDPGLAAFFAPRKVAPAADQTIPAAAARARADIIMRPRTVATWRVPADGRRFRAGVSAAADPLSADPVLVTVAVDDRELFRRQLGTQATADEEDDAGIPIDVDLTGSRRLTVTVDFLPGNGIGGAVRFSNPIIER